MTVCFRKKERPNINNINQSINNLKKSIIQIFHLRKPEKDEQLKHKAKRGNKILKIKAEISKMVNIKTIEKNNETKSWFCEMIGKMDTMPARLTKIKRAVTQMTSIRYQRAVITADLMDIKRMVQEYYQQFYTCWVYNFDEMHQYLERHKLSKLTQGKMIWICLHPFQKWNQ